MHVPDRFFTATGFLRGVRTGLPLAAGNVAYGVVFGVLAKHTGLSLPEAVLMSGLVYAGAAQFVALGIWASPVPVLSLAITTLVVNLRFLLMGATLQPWLRRLSPVKKYACVVLLDDESWALTFAEWDAGRSDRAFLIGCQVVLYCTWLGGTASGEMFGGLITDPKSLGLDFVFIAFLTALLVGRYRGFRDFVPWLAAGFTSVVASVLLPGHWYVLLGAVVGTLVGIRVHAD